MEIIQAHKLSAPFFCFYTTDSRALHLGLLSPIVNPCFQYSSRNCLRNLNFSCARNYHYWLPAIGSFHLQKLLLPVSCPKYLPPPKLSVPVSSPHTLMPLELTILANLILCLDSFLTPDLRIASSPRRFDACEMSSVKSNCVINCTKRKD